jgi:hypothetical protein
MKNLFTSLYSWTIAKVGVKHQSIKQRILDRGETDIL